MYVRRALLLYVKLIVWVPTANRLNQHITTETFFSSKLEPATKKPARFSFDILLPYVCWALQSLPETRFLVVLWLFSKIHLEI